MTMIIRFRKLAILIFMIVPLGVFAQTVKDADGNIYKTVTIGKQTWMAENLKAKKFSNGEAIPTTSDPKLDIKQENVPMVYQWAFEGDTTKVPQYGRLYTFYAVVDKRNICPTGWHVPTQDEWKEMIAFLGGEDVAGKKLKEKGEIHWEREYEETNETGFTARAGGYRNGDGPYGGLRAEGYWWTSTAQNEYFAWYWTMVSGYSTARTDYAIPKENGLSVRCIKNK